MNKPDNKLHAILIGIDDYLPARLPDGHTYRSLDGAVLDVTRMATLLRERAGLTEERTRLLRARTGDDGQYIEKPHQLPTYANLVAVFKRVALEAEPGDRVYVHFSGHGARVPTEYPEIKGHGGMDEALVPCDIGDPGSRYLRDLELASLVQLLVDHELLVTVVLDCCHAGGAMRSGHGGGAVARQVRWVRRDDRVPSAVAERDVLMAAWPRAPREERRFRGVTIESWMPASGYALFAACRPDEQAFEAPFEKNQRHGALTYWLHDTLSRYGTELPCGEFHQRLVSRVRGQLVDQTPVFLGDAGRGFLSHEVTRDSQPAASVLRIREDGLLMLAHGQVTGAKEGQRLMVSGLSGPVEVEIRQVGSTESWAEVVHRFEPGEIEPGARAEVLPLQVRVRLIGEAGPALREALRQGKGNVVEVETDGDPADLCVAIEDGAFTILDPGGTPFLNIAPLPVRPESVREMIRRLEHLAKFRSILLLENPKPLDDMKIGLELVEDGKNVPLSSRTLDLRVGDPQVTLRIVNRSTQRLDFVVLNLDPDYRVCQAVPGKNAISALMLDPGQGETVKVSAWLPPGMEEGRDVLKIFATSGGASYRWLELPPLTRAGQPSPYRGEPKDPLEILFAHLAADRPPKRSLEVSDYPEREWVTAQVEIRVRR